MGKISKIVLLLLALFIFLGSRSINSEASNIFAGWDNVGYNYYAVSKGDTLYWIARRHRVSLSELMRVNNLSGSIIRPGEVLVMPVQAENKLVTARGEFSRQDLMLLARLIYAEARGECFEGQVAVGAVILNRVFSPQFPKSVRGVILQKSGRVYQFSPVGDGTINLEPDEKAINAAMQAIQGEDPSDGALFFYNPELSNDRWIRTLPVVRTIGNHVFATCFKPATL
ncbi:MAG: LysM peptidoglycan-binding domain-containing protein [Peptococcaceae bacterium]|nr:MAG: LysM peptidoglycan-binding domain-containing protein [Peptococcaceae bacterium]